MGLQRKQGEIVQEGQQFDIRGSVDEFRHSIGMYMFWKPGMEIYVSHVRRKQLPAYVFPDGYKRPRNLRLTPQQQSGKLSHDNGVACQTESGEKCLKRKKDPDGENSEQSRPEKRQSLDRSESVSPEIISCKLSSTSPGFSTSDLDEMNGLAEGNASSNSSVISYCSREDIGNESTAGSSDRSNGGDDNPASSQSDSCDDSKSPVEDEHADQNRVFQDGLLEELEVLDLSFLIFPDFIYHLCLVMISFFSQLVASEYLKLNHFIIWCFSVP